MRSNETTLTDFTSNTSGDDQNRKQDHEETSGSTHLDQTRAKVHETGNNEYGTPPWLIRKLHRGNSGLFDIDVAAGAEPVQIAQDYWTKEDDAFTQDWTSAEQSLFMNPEFSDPLPWFQELTSAVNPSDPDCPDYAVALSPTNMSANWCQNHVLEYATVLAFPEERIDYVGPGRSPQFPTLISVFGEPPQSLIDEIGDFCQLCTPVEVAEAYEQQSLSTLIADGGAVAALPLETPQTSTSPHERESLDIVSAHDILEITFETATLAYRGSDGVPKHVTVRVLRGGKEIDVDKGTITVDAIGQDSCGNDVCISLRSSAELTNTVDVVVAVGMDHWRHIPVTEITHHPS